jgi:DNA repair protein RadC
MLQLNATLQNPREGAADAAPFSYSCSYLFDDAGILMSEQEAPYVLKVRDLAEDDRPREKLIKHGPQDLLLSELVAILLGVGTRREEVLSMAQRIVREYGERALMHETDPGRLAKALDLPLAKACQLIACFELGRRFYENRAGKPVVVRTARQAFEHLSGMADLQKEQLRALYLNSRYQVIHEEVVSIGNLTANIVHPREVFQPAIQYGAAAVIVAHNHPSGSLEATGADLDATQQLMQAGQLLGIELLDHLLIAHGTFISIIEDSDD